MDSSISVAVMTRLREDGTWDDLLLDGRELSKGISTPISPRPIMIPSHSAQMESILSMPERFSILAMRLTLLSLTRGLDKLLTSIISCLQETKRGDKVYVIFQTEGEVLLVLLAEIHLLEHLVGEAHALSVGDDAACDHGTDNVPLGDLFYVENQKAVVYKNPVAHLDIIGEALIAYGNPGIVALYIVYGEGEGVALVDSLFYVFKHADAVLRALGVQQDGDGHIQLFTDLLYHLDPFFMLLIIAVRKVESRHVHTRKAKSLDSLLVGACGTYCTNDLGFTHNTALHSRL
jgi:hypothetical protein